MEWSCTIHHPSYARLDFSQLTPGMSELSQDQLVGAQLTADV